MKKTFTLIAWIALFSTSTAQNTAVLLCDFDSIKKVAFKDYDGILDSAFANPMTSGANTSSTCARYIRKNVQYDNLKLYAHTKFVEISNFAQASTPSKMSMMVMSKMPAGTKIDIQLGSRQYQSYPQGIHSIYTGTTTAVNQWETITFNLSTNLSSNGGFPYPGSIDKLVILFNTNAITSDTIYFDQVMGPAIEAAVSIPELKTASFKVKQNTPNPATEFTSVNLELSTAGQVQMYLTDLLGRKVLTPVNGYMNSGEHQVKMELNGLPDGVYFYTVQKGSDQQTKKMVIAR